MMLLIPATSILLLEVSICPDLTGSNSAKLHGPGKVLCGLLFSFLLRGMGAAGEDVFDLSEEFMH